MHLTKQIEYYIWEILLHTVSNEKKNFTLDSIGKLYKALNWEGADQQPLFALAYALNSYHVYVLDTALLTALKISHKLLLVQT